MTSSQEELVVIIEGMWNVAMHDAVLNAHIGGMLGLVDEVTINDIRPLGKTISTAWMGLIQILARLCFSRLVHVHFLATTILEGILELYSRSEVSSGVLDDSFWQNYDLLLMDAVTLDGVCKEVYHYYDMERQKFFEIPASLLIMFSEISQGYENDDSVWRNARLVLYLSRLASVLSKPLMNALSPFGI